MKLYILHAGSITCPDKSGLAPKHPSGAPFTFPVYMYLIDHPQGLVAVDTGIAKDHWFDFQQPGMDVPEDLRIDRQISALGFRPDQVRYVIQTHLHADHTGGMPHLPNAQFIVRREELREAWWPEERLPVGGPYTYADYKDCRSFQYIELEDNVDYDVFGDGSVVCIDTKGHSRGHQSVVVRLPNSGTIVIAADAASLKEQIDDCDAPGGHLWSTEASMIAIDRLRALRERGALVLLGHEPGQADNLKFAPAYYD